MKLTIKMLAMLAILGLPVIASAECNSADKEVGFVDGNSVSSDCVEVANMVPTEPSDPPAVEPTAAQEPNPNPSAGEEGGGGEGGEGQ